MPRHLGMCIAAVGCLCPALASAVGDTATNQSVQYLGSGGVRNASEDVDAAFFNPAGLTFLENGLHYQVANQIITQTKRIEDVDAASAQNGSTYPGDAGTLLFPTLAVAYKHSAWAVYLHGGPYGSSATADFDEGVPVTRNMGLDYTIRARPMLLGATLGGAYRLHERVALALGARYYYASSTIELADDADGLFSTESSGSGFGLLCSLDAHPIDRLTVALQYMWNSTLETKSHVAKAQGSPAGIGNLVFPEGTKARVQLPMLLMLGVAYQAHPRVRVELDSLLYLQGANDLGKVEDGSSPLNGKPRSDYFGTGYELGIGVEGALLPGLLTLRAGYMYGHDGQERAIADEFSYYLDYHQTGFGLDLHIWDELTLQASYFVAFMVQGKKNGANTLAFNDGPGHFVGLGLQGRFAL